MRFLMILVAAAAGAAWPASAPAQAVCPEGKTFAGTCVKSELGETTRKSVLIYSQPKISYTAPPLLPGEDGAYATPRDTYEIRRIYGLDTGSVCTTVAGRGGSVTTCP